MFAAERLYILEVVELLVKVMEMVSMEYPVVRSKYCGRERRQRFWSEE